MPRSIEVAMDDFSKFTKSGLSWIKIPTYNYKTIAKSVTVL